MSTDPAEHEQQEEDRPYRPKPRAVKLQPADREPRHPCPAYPPVGLMAGATIGWCRRSRGKLAACAKCEWRNV
jgi:hypothetical protein